MNGKMLIGAAVLAALAFVLVPTMARADSLAGAATEKAASAAEARDPATMYLRECVTAVNAFLRCGNAKGDAIKTCEDPLLGVERRAEVTGSKVMLDKGELSVEVQLGPNKRSYTQRMRASVTCKGKPGDVSCKCDVADMCCRDKFCCTFIKGQPPDCRPRL